MKVNIWSTYWTAEDVEHGEPSRTENVAGLEVTNVRAFVNTLKWGEASCSPLCANCGTHCWVRTIDEPSTGSYVIIETTTHPADAQAQRHWGKLC